MTCNSQSTQQIVHSIISSLSHWNLRTSYYNSLLQILYHERKTAGCKAHCICPMNDDEGIKLLVVSLNDVKNLVDLGDTQVC